MEEKKQENSQKIVPQLIEDEMKTSYLEYSMSVIVGRALPDVRDGLKPVHRRILYAMNEMGMFHNKPFKKCARIVGEVLGKFHPHGDTAVFDALVRMVQDFSLRYTLIKGQGNFGCFTKDTKVALTDGRNLSFKELVKEDKDKKNYTYTITKNGNVEVAEIKKPRLTKKNQKILKVILDNGEEVKCTLDHKFMLRDGSYKEAQYLKSGDSLMPLYLRSSTEKDTFNPALKDYQLIYQPKTDKWIPAHNLADDWNLKKGIYEVSSGRIRHHVDFNRLNNNPENIKRIKWKDHWKLHADHASELHKNPEYREKIAEGRKKFWSNEKNREASAKRLSERNKKNWKNPEYRKHMIKFLSEVNIEFCKKHPELKEEKSRRLKKLWKNKEYQEMMSKLKSEEMKERWAKKDPSLRKFTSEESKKIWSSLGHREFISNLIKEKWKDKKYKEKITNAHKEKWKKDIKFRNYFLNILSENGKKANYCKFLILCRKTIEEHGNLNEENYEKVRISYNSRKGAGVIRFNIALDKFFDDDVRKLYKELGINIVKLNHKVKNVIFLNKKHDVYDLTIEKTHNFALASGVFVHNSIDGDRAAAMRYVEAKLNKRAEEMLQDIDKKTVKFVDNFDGSLKEPSVLPAKFPNLLVNGSSGIAVGMATNIPPHNLGEVIDGTIALIDNSELDVYDLMKYVKAPDFPTAGIIYGKNGIKNAYTKGRGKIVLRAKSSVEEIKGKKRIIVSEIPYMVNKSLMLEHMAGLVRDKKIEGIKFIRDESDRKGMRVVIGLKTDTNPDLVLNQLFAHTRLQVSFGIIMLALVNNEPKVLNLKEMITNFIDHRRVIVRKRTEFDLKKASDRAHVLEGIIIALDDIDNVIVKIKKSTTVEQASQVLISDYSLTEIQSKAILDMRLQKLASLEQEKIKKEHKELLALIEELKAVLADEKKILEIIKQELIELKEEYADERRTLIEDAEISSLEITKEDLIKEEDMVVTITHGGYIKRLGIGTYRTQGRGGKGVIAATTREGDFVENLFVASTHDYLLFFTNKGKVKWLKVFEIPEVSRQSKGKAVVNLLQLSEDEKITAFVPVRKFDGFLIMITKNGVVKKTSLDLFSRPRKGGIAAIKLDADDELINVERTIGEEQIIIATRNGMAIRFSEDDLRPMGRNARGVRGIRLKEKDSVIGSVIAFDEDTLFTITENGYGKRSKVDDYRLIGRGGSGVKNIVCSERNGKVVDINSVTEKDDIMVVSKNGVAIRMHAKDISVIGRATQGVRIMKLEKDKVVAAAKIVE